MGKLTPIANGNLNSERLDHKGGWFAVGGIIAAIVASSCCILPLAFVLLGVSGAWIGNLTALEPYKPYFIAITLVFLGLGYWRVYFQKTPVCAEGSYCAKPNTSFITQIVLWLGTVLVLLAATISFWAPFFY